MVDTSSRNHCDRHSEEKRKPVTSKSERTNWGGKKYISFPYLLFYQNMNKIIFAYSFKIKFWQFQQFWGKEDSTDHAELIENVENNVNGVEKQHIFHQLFQLFIQKYTQPQLTA